MLYKNVAILGLSQALGTAGSSLIVLTGGIIGASLAPVPELSTLPIAVVVLGTALFTVPASLLMKRVGRKPGFMAATMLSALASLGAAYAVSIHSFFLFCIMTLLIGGNLAFIQQFRFAAAESVPQHAGRAVSLVLLGGIAAGILGPFVARIAKDWVPGVEYAGSFLLLAVLYLGVTVLLAFYQEILAKQTETAGMERPLREIISQPVFLAAMVAGTAAYGVMSFIMTATPISMHSMDGHSLAETSEVIQSHIVAMYLPSLFTGLIIGRLGVRRVMGAGVISMTACVGLTLLGRGLPNYWSALVLLGLGWNFLFIGSTVLLTQSYLPSERFKTLAVNELVVFGVQAFASLSAGTVLYRLGWNAVNLISLPVLLMVVLSIVLIQRRVSLPAGA